MTMPDPYKAVETINAMLKPKKELDGVISVDDKPEECERCGCQEFDEETTVNDSCLAGDHVQDEYPAWTCIDCGTTYSLKSPSTIWEMR